VKACFPRTHFADEKQLKLATGIPNDANWEATANKLQRRLQLELEEGKLATADGSFNVERYREILEEYGLRAKLRVVKSVTTSDGQLPPKPELSILEVWDMYCEHIKPRLAITTYETIYTGDYRRYLCSAINQVGEDSLSIRNWLVTNRDPHNAKKILSLLGKAFALSIRQGRFFGQNPFEGLSEEIQDKKRIKEINQNDYDEDKQVENKNLAFTWDEAETIMEFLRNSNNAKFSHWYHFISFKFLTGCRQGEAIALWWCDINWEREHILIRRSYSSRLKKFKPTKNETTRIFPMPKNGRLWNLLKELPLGNHNEVVFKNRENSTIHHCSFGDNWKGTTALRKNKTYNYPGICQTLVNEGKLSKYLPSYNTRHTFITHQIYDLGRDKDIVNAWCEHSEKISVKYYRNTANIATQINPEFPANDLSSQKSKVEALEEQIEQMKAMIEKLTNK
jgi:integrase